MPFRIAASILMIIAAGIGAWKYLGYETIFPAANHALQQNATDSKTKLILPDSSVVWLNANSSVEYDSDFGTRSRNVHLKGEAFFDVRKGTKDFIVMTENLSIRVKGTRFNVSVNSSEGTEETTLEEGSVALQVLGSGQEYEMKPGDQISFNRTANKVIIQKVNPSYYTAWKEDKLVFENSALGDIARKLENRYKVVIEIDSALAKRENLSMTIRDETLEEVLELIRLSSSLKYTAEANKIIIYE